MAISEMAKTIIVSHRSEATELLESLQRQGICQILNAEEAMVCKDVPDLVCAGERPKDIEGLINRIEKSIAFLSNYTKQKKGLADVLAPRTVIDKELYNQVITDKGCLSIVESCERAAADIEKLRAEFENIERTLELLRPWASLKTPVEEINQLETATTLTGLLPNQNVGLIEEELAELWAVIEMVGTSNNKCACLVVCLTEQVPEVQKLLRSADFEAVSFESMTGRVSELIKEHEKKLKQTLELLQRQYRKAAELSENMLKLQILCDHYRNLFNRECTKASSPATNQTVILEGWVRKRDYPRLERTIAAFGASSLNKVAPAEGEEIPVEIENKALIKPFEVVTRLYGMPQHISVDPTVFLAPFFAMFFALCLTDAGYGLVMLIAIALFMRKIQGNKNLLWMLAICSVATVAAGALTGGWFGDAVQQLNIGWLNAIRNKMMWFDPIEEPMMFFKLSLVLGYSQILAGLAIALFHNLKQKQFTAAICDQLTWLVMLNSIVIYIASKSSAAIPAEVGKFFGVLALVPAAIILLFSQRQGGWAGKLGMGFYNLFSTIFYMGDVLSYLRLMALGMVTAGLAMAINVIAKITLAIPYGIGVIVMILILVGGHSFNMAINALGAFVHTLRLQYAEFFPKFLIGGGRLFEPLAKEYKHVYIRKT